MEGGECHVKASADSYIIDMPEYSVKDRGFLHCHSIINLNASNCDVVNVEVLKRVHHSPFTRILDDVHGFLHWPEGMALVQEVLGIFRFPVHVLIVIFMLSEADLEGSSCLPGVLLTGRACELVDTALGVFTTGIGRYQQ